MGVILKENNIIHTKRKHDKFLGSSRYRFDAGKNMIVLKPKNKPVVKKETESVNNDNLDYFHKERMMFLGRDISNVLIEQKNTSDLLESENNETIREYKLNKKKVREKCSAFFGLKKSRKFLAFYSISFPLNFPDDMCMKVFNTFLTRLRKDFRLRSYLWVAERQKNGTLHFHLLTNCYMPIRRVNYYMAKAIETQIKKNKIDVSFDVTKYNGVDVKRVNNNRKALNIYLTKYVSKNSILFYRLPYHSSRDISELFTAESFVSVNHKDFKHIADVLQHITTYVIDSEFATIEYLCQKQENGKHFNPPDDWYWLRDFLNDLIYYNHYSSDKHTTIPLGKCKENISQ